MWMERAAWGALQSNSQAELKSVFTSIDAAVNDELRIGLHVLPKEQRPLCAQQVALGVLTRCLSECEEEVVFKAASALASVVPYPPIKETIGHLLACPHDDPEEDVPQAHECLSARQARLSPAP